ncbi:MAG: hypothetical protein Kapaf2KO_16220 [Candidatus Kapaibacteriales bacterium]
MLQFPDRDYNLEDQELWSFVSDTIVNMTRDETEFAERGVTTIDRDAFEAEGNAFEQILPDTYYRGRITSAVATKDVSKKTTETLVQTVSGYVQQKFGLNSGEYKSLGIKGYGTMREGQQITAARQCANVAEDLLLDLTGIGLTQAKIDELKAAAQTYEDGRNEVSKREGTRENKTRERIDAGNSLYAKLSEYCEIGKLIWENTNPAYYNDYIIYKSSQSSLSKVQGFAAAETSPNNFLLTWDPVVNADEYQVEFAEATIGQPQNAWQTHETTANTNSNFTTQAGFEYWLRVRARNGNGETGTYSDVVQIQGS